MARTWFEVVFRRRPHPALRLVGELTLCSIYVMFLITVVPQFDGALWWLCVLMTPCILLLQGRGVFLAVRDLRHPDRTPAAG